MPFHLQISVVLLSLGLQACWAQRSGPVVIGQTFIAATLDAPNGGSAPWATTSHGISEKLFTVNKEGNIVGQVAQSLTKIDAFTWDVTLKSGYKFSDGTAVTGALVATALTELNAHNGAATSSLGVMTVTAPSSSTVRINSTKSTPIMDSVLAEWVFVVFYKDSGGNFVYTGPYKIAPGGFTSTQIDLVPNTYYPTGAAGRPVTIIKQYAGGAALAEAAKADEIDIGFHLASNQKAEVHAVEGQSVKSFETGYHYFMLHNTDTLELKVRQAIDLAIDREALATALHGGTATRSLFPDYSPFFLSDAGGSSLAGDSTAAGNLLDSAGWTKDAGTGKRTKAGEDLTVTLVAYEQRPGLPIMQPVVSQALTALGITVTSITTSGSSWDELDVILGAKSYDLLMYAQNTLPSGDPYAFLHGAFHSTGTANWMRGESWANSSTLDPLIDALSAGQNHSARVTASAAVQTQLQVEVPVSNLVTPLWHVSVSDRMTEYVPWGSDYHIVRADYVAVDLGLTAPSPPGPNVVTTVSEDDDSALPWILLGVCGGLCLIGTAVTYKMGKKKGMDEALLKKPTP
eukprot:COSAG05_NODE_149_length_16213_cov_66.750279_9_plen_572_part_00